MSKSKGQIMPYFLVLLIVLVISWAMLINVAKLLRDRMMMQNAADNAALSIAVYKARAMNTLGLLNYAIAATLYGPEIGPTSGSLSYYRYAVTCSITGIPTVLPLAACPMGGVPPSCYPPGLGAVDSQKKVAAYLDLLPGSNGTTYIKYIREMVTLLSRCQDSVRIPFDTNVPLQALATTIGQRQEQNSSGQYTGADLVIVRKGVALGLLRNKNGVVYHRSRKLEGIGAELAKGTVNAFFKAVLDIPIEIRDIYSAEKWNENKQSWLYADKYTFALNQKVTVMALKSDNSLSNRGYPLFGKWLGITWPDMTTTAAAGLYDSNGPMFPLEEPGKPSDRISAVIREYKKARFHGWDAHLVPVTKGMGH